MASLLPLLISCEGGGSSSAASAATGVDCVRHSDCQNELRCSFGRCHVACHEARDCPAGQTCVIDDDERNVCLLPDEETCALNSECPPPLVCAQDLRCRNECNDERDCATETQRCVETMPEGRVCAEPEDLVDGGLLWLERIDYTPNAASDAGTRDGGEDAPGGGDSGASDAATDQVDVAGDGGGESEGDVDAAVDGGGDAAGGDDGDGGPSDAGNDAAAADASTLPGSEIEPNDSAEQATAYTTGQRIEASIGARDDVDYYAVTVPTGDVAGGYFRGFVTDPGAGGVGATVTDASTHAQVVAAIQVTAGPSAFFYWAGAPGETYHVAVHRTIGANSFSYGFQIEYSPVADAHEPNQTRDEPASIGLGEIVEAYTFAGFSEQATVVGDYADWYAIDEPLTAGTLTATVSEVATNCRLSVQLFDESNAMVSDAVLGDTGADVTADFTIEEPGTYRVVIGVVAPAPPTSGASLTLPDNFTRPYRLTLSHAP